MLNTVKSLNEIIEKELMLNHFDGGKKIKELYNTAYELYINLASISARSQKSENQLFLPDAVIELAENIKRLEAELIRYQVVEPYVILSNGAIVEPQFTEERDLVEKPKKK